MPAAFPPRSEPGGRAAAQPRPGNKPVSPQGHKPAPWNRSCRRAGTWRAARSPGAEAGSAIWRSDPVTIGRRQVTVTECNEQTITNWLQYAHIDSLRPDRSRTVRRDSYRSPSSRMAQPRSSACSLIQLSRELPLCPPNGRLVKATLLRDRGQVRPAVLQRPMYTRVQAPVNPGEHFGLSEISPVERRGVRPCPELDHHRARCSLVVVPQAAASAARS